MRLPAKTLIEIGQVLPEALIEPQDARPVLLPEFRQTVTVPGVVQPIDNVPTGVQNRSFMFGNGVEVTNSGVIAVDLASLSPGMWTIDYNLHWVSIIPAAVNNDYFSVTLGAVRHIFANFRRTTTPDSRSLSGSFTVLLRDEAAFGYRVGVTVVGELINLGWGFNCSRIL